MRPARATEAEITAALDGVAPWERVGDAIRRTFERPSFPDAIAFVTRVGFAAEARDHHPDIDIRYRSVTLTLSTHDAGGLTELDFELAAAIEAFA